jgi:RNA polymerase sigma-70 factor (ECF subfamily)
MALAEGHRRGHQGPVIIRAKVRDDSLLDVDLIHRVAQADPRAFLLLYDRFAARVYGLALRMIGNAMGAEDVAQEAFLKVWSRAGSYRAERGSLIAWILTITRRTALDRLRSEARRSSPADPLDPESILLELPDPRTNSTEARWRSLHLMLTDLPAEQRQVIDLAFYSGLSHSQIADHLGLPLGTVKTRLRLGMERLRQAWLAPEADEPDRSASRTDGVKDKREASQT